jgi:hypothetical protein
MLATAFGPAIICGCGAPRGPRADEQVLALTEEKAQLNTRLEEAESQNQRLTRQVEILSKLPAEARLEKLFTVSSIRIGRYTNFYDEDKDGSRETLIVYFAPHDGTGDPLKAAGAVDGYKPVRWVTDYAKYMGNSC